MSLYEAIRLIEAIADEASERYPDEFDNGRVGEALGKVDSFLMDIGEE